jgi:hypothetical protein
MRRITLVVVAILTVVPLLLQAQGDALLLEARPDAAHARLGTWKLNLQKSKIDPASPTTYTSETRVYTDAGAQGMTQGVNVSITTVGADGKTLTRSYTAKYDGKEYRTRAIPMRTPSASNKSIPTRRTPFRRRRARSPSTPIRPYRKTGKC